MKPAPESYRFVVAGRGRDPRDDAALHAARAALATHHQVLLALCGRGLATHHQVLLALCGRGLARSTSQRRAREALLAGVQLAVEEERVAARDEATVKAGQQTHLVLNHTKEVWSVMRPVACTMIFTSPHSSSGWSGTYSATCRFMSTFISALCTSSLDVSLKVQWAYASTALASCVVSNSF